MIGNTVQVVFTRTVAEVSQAVCTDVHEAELAGECETTGIGLHQQETLGRERNGGIGGPVDSCLTQKLKAVGQTSSVFVTAAPKGFLVYPTPNSLVSPSFISNVCDFAAGIVWSVIRSRNVAASGRTSVFSPAEAAWIETNPEVPLITSSVSQ